MSGSRSGQTLKDVIRELDAAVAEGREVKGHDERRELKGGKSADEAVNVNNEGNPVEEETKS